MSTNMSAPPSAPPMPPPSGPPSSGGHGSFSDEDIQQMMADTGMSYEQVCAAIDANPNAKTPQDVFPNIYSGAGIQPQSSPDGQMASDGVVQGQPPAQAGMNAAPPPGQPGTAPAMAPPESSEGEPAQSAPMEAAEGEGIDPRVAQAMHSAMAPSKYKRRGK